ncbi:MAG: ATP synthase F1 subunit gamma [Phycisphaerales bacterium]
MANAREIKKRIKAVGNIKRITKTMQMIATSKFARAQQKAMASKPYVEGVFELVGELASRGASIEHPLIAGADQLKKDAPEVVLVMTSDRGLCGPYNGNVIRTALKTLRETDRTRTEVVGRKGVSVLKFNRFEIATHHTQFGDQPRYEDVERLAQSYMDAFTKGEISGVKVVYMRFVSTARQRPEVLQLLPLRPPVADEEQAGGLNTDFEFSPEPAELLAELLPETVKTTLFQAFNDAVVSEHVARMVAMKAATDNAGKMGKTYKRIFNRARQAQITTELTEIISGAAALE